MNGDAGARLTGNPSGRLRRLRNHDDRQPADAKPAQTVYGMYLGDESHDVEILHDYYNAPNRFPSI